MYRVLIIDDEEPVRLAIKMLGEWGKLGIEDLYEASDGKSGLMMLEKHKPQIVIVDMKMPVMDGVKFLEYAKSLSPSSIYIVVSGYDDFEYTKYAIRFNVLDYLLKPVAANELNNVLEKAVSKLDEEQANMEHELARSMKLNLSIDTFREKIFSSIIESIEWNPVFDNYLRIMNFENRDYIYAVSIIRIINPKEVFLNKFNGDIYTAFFAFTNVINEILANWNNSFSFKNSKSEHEIIIILSLPLVSDAEAKRKSANKIREIVSTLEKLFKLFSVASVGEFYPSYRSLSYSLKKADEILRSINLLDNMEMVFTEVEPTARDGRNSMLDYKEMLLNALESGNLEYARTIIQNYFDRIKKSGYFSADEAYKMAVEFILIIEDIASRLGVNIQKEITKYLQYGKLMVPISKFEDFSGIVVDMVEKIFNSIETEFKSFKKADINSIKDYIDKNYFKEIKLSLFSCKYYLSKEYLSKQFKDEFGYGIYEYVLKVRMEKAKELLENANVKVQTISEQLGYNDNNYFSKAFKKYYGSSPSEYRQEVLQQKPVG